MVVVDRLTKYAHFIGLSHPYTAKDVAAVLDQEVVRLHDFPAKILTDRDILFISNFWTNLFKQTGTKLHYTSAYHPQTDGQTKVVNQCLELYLRCFTSTKPKQWAKWLSWAELWFNTSYNVSSSTTPFRALYRRDPPVLVRDDTTPSNIEELNELIADRNAILDELKWFLHRAQERMKNQANKILSFR